MKEKEKGPSKGDLWNFVKDATDNPEVKNRFIETLQQPSISARTLLDFLYLLGYRGASLDECQELLNQVKNPKRLLDCWNAQY